MPCSDARRLMDDAVDDDMPQELKLHLASCADCAADWQRLESVDARLRSVSLDQPPADFAARVLARVESPVDVPLDAVIGRHEPARLLAAEAPTSPVATGDGLGRPLQLAGALVAILLLGALSRMANLGALASPAPQAAMVPAMGRLLVPFSEGLLGLVLMLCLAASMAALWFGLLVLPRSMLPTWYAESR